MNVIVVYSSKYGSTRQYAGWLGEDLSVPVVSFRDAKQAQIEAADPVILGSSVNMGSITLKNWIRRNWRTLAPKRLILFTVSGTPPGETEKLRAVLANSLTQEMIGRMRWFPLHGRIRFSTLPAPLRFMLEKFSGRGKTEDGGEPAMQEFDAVDRKNIAPIVEAVRALMRDAPS